MDSGITGMTGFFFTTLLFLGTTFFFLKQLSQARQELSQLKGKSNQVQSHHHGKPNMIRRKEQHSLREQ